jgi:hypothetical protein
MRKTIFDIICESRNNNYCHCVECSETYELESIAESIYDEFEETHTKEEITDFLESLTVYALKEENEEEIYKFSFTKFVNYNLI